MTSQASATALAGGTKHYVIPAKDEPGAGAGAKRRCDFTPGAVVNSHYYGTLVVFEAELSHLASIIPRHVQPSSA
jgi:hypothetical protein